MSISVYGFYLQVRAIARNMTQAALASGRGWSKESRCHNSPSNALCLVAQSPRRDPRRSSCSAPRSCQALSYRPCPSGCQSPPLPGCPMSHVRFSGESEVLAAPVVRLVARRRGRRGVTLEAAVVEIGWGADTGGSLAFEVRWEKHCSEWR